MDGWSFDVVDNKVIEFLMGDLEVVSISLEPEYLVVFIKSL
jgi:hypothetical protein